MKTFKVYFRHNRKSDVAYVDAPSLKDVKWRLLGRFYDAKINKIVDVTFDSEEE